MLTQLGETLSAVLLVLLATGMLTLRDRGHPFTREGPRWIAMLSFRGASVVLAALCLIIAAELFHAGYRLLVVLVGLAPVAAWFAARILREDLMRDR